MADSGAFGATFAPFPDPSGQNAAVAPVQQAIQLLSLRVPRVVGAAAPAPAALLNSPGSSGRPDVHSAVLQTILRTIMGQGMPMADAQPPVSPVSAPPLDAAPSPTDAPPVGASSVAPPPPMPPVSNAPPSPFAGAPRDVAPEVPSGPPPVPNFKFEPPNAPRDVLPNPDAQASSLPPPDQRGDLGGSAALFGDSLTGLKRNNAN